MTTLLQKINDAFSKRVFPRKLCEPATLSPEEYAEVLSFSKEHWSVLNGGILETNFDVLCWLTPEAFCYYLPGILSTGIRENMPELLVNHSLINMLDRSPESEYWDDFFLARWTLLNQLECDALIEWVLWLSSFEEVSYSDNSLSRAFDTLELLKTKVRS